MSRYIGIYVKHCDLCNQTKVQRRRPIGGLHPSETPEAPWDTQSSRLQQRPTVCRCIHVRAL
jgi:hypothetical protein